MGQSLNTVALNDFVSLVRINWVARQDLIQGNARQMYIEQDLGFHNGESKRFKEIDPEEFASLKREGADASIATVALGYEKDMTVRRFAKEISITHEMRRYNHAPEVMSKLHSLQSFGPQRMEIDLTHRLTFGTATSYTDMDGETVTTTVGDGLALVSAVHTVTESATTYSNIITGNPAGSQGGLEVAELQANTQILDNFGNLRVMNFNVIFCSNDPTTVNTFKQILKSSGDVDGTHAGIENVYMNKYRLVILPRLATTAAGAYDPTKKGYWGLAAIGQGEMGWQAYLGIWEGVSLKTPAPGNNGEDFHNDNWSFGTRLSYGIVTVSPRGLLLSTGAGS